ncbi:Rid family detoxifying hydrolase [Fructilactobacillus sp. Tb1]|uniref:Rid family detoxifying hydrolase n=1 Tax=Fructilactobacillus sp. Tb1 TaxID=3422304 RepID=UPI003D2789BD
MLEAVATEKAPKALGPYSQAVKKGNSLYCSGQIGLNPETNKLAEGVEGQAAQALNNLAAVLQQAKFAKNDVVKMTVFMTDMSNFQSVNQVYADFFKDNEVLPARSAVAVRELPANALVEMEAVAQK